MRARQRAGQEGQQRLVRHRLHRQVTREDRDGHRDAAALVVSGPVVQFRARDVAVPLVVDTVAVAVDESVVDIGR